MEIVYKGICISINEDLLAKQCAYENLQNIVKIRVKIVELFNDIKVKLSQVPLTRSFRQEVLHKIRQYDYALQEYWKFDRDVSQHTYHWCLPGCICPTEDNMDLLGTGLRMVVPTCIWHGKEIGGYYEV